MSWAGRLFSILVLWALAGTGALAQAVPHAAVRQAVAIVAARGVNVSDNSPVASVGTGFFINSAGVLVTSYHLRENLGANVHEPTITFEVHFDPFAPAVPAKEVWSSEDADLLVLWVPISGRTVGVLHPSFSTSNIQLARTPVYAASFAAGSDFSMTPGVITAFSGPIAPEVVPSWTTNVNFAEGQSGSPVVLEDGRVVAVVKGAYAGGASMGIVVPVLFIPSQYWDAQSNAVQTLASLGPNVEPARVTVSKTILTNEPRQVVRNLILTRDVCDPRIEQRVHVPASPGSTIDPTSIQVITRSFKGKELRGAAVDDVTATAFDLTANIVPEGVCMRFLSSQIQPPARYEAEVRYLERPTSAQPQEVVVAEAAALPGVQLPVGKSAQGLNYSIVSASGQRSPFVPQANDLKVLNGQKVLDLTKVLSRLE